MVKARRVPSTAVRNNSGNRPRNGTRPAATSEPFLSAPVQIGALRNRPAKIAPPFQPPATVIDITIAPDPAASIGDSILRKAVSVTNQVIAHSARNATTPVTVSRDPSRDRSEPLRCPPTIIATTKLAA